MQLEFFVLTKKNPPDPKGPWRICCFRTVQQQLRKQDFCDTRSVERR